MRKIRARKAARSAKSRTGSSQPAKRPARYAGRDRQPQAGRGAPETPVSADARELEDPGRPAARFALDSWLITNPGLEEFLPAPQAAQNLAGHPEP